MSRVGKHPVAVPAGVDVAIKGQEVTVKGKLGELKLLVNAEVSVTKQDNAVVIAPRNESRLARNNWGTVRNIIRNMVKGVTEGYTCDLELQGVGYRCQLQGKDLVLQLGYSHEVRFPIPKGITIKSEKPTEIQISGADKQQVGQVAAEIISVRPTEPYKGKGVRKKGAWVRRKEGKKK